MNKIEQGAIYLLHNMTELTDLLGTRNSPDFDGIEDDADFASFFPDLVWTLRDFYLGLETDGQLITADEYLENSLRLKPGLENLVLTYINAINSGDLPCMENAVQALVQVENTVAVQKAMDHYEQKMDQKVQLCTETLQELLDLQRACEREAIEIFRKNSFKDEDQSFQKELETQLHAKQNDICKQNLDTSSDHCSALLQDIFGPLEEAVKQGIYSKPGGHTLFLQKTEELKAKYYQKPRKGIQAVKALQKYLKSKESVSEAILQTDQALTTKEKEKEAERVRVEAAKAEAQRLEAICRYNQQQMEEKRRLHQQQVRQMEINRANFLAQQQRAQEQ